MVSLRSVSSVFFHDRPKLALSLPAIQNLTLGVEPVAKSAPVYRGLQVSCSGTDRRYLWMDL